MKPSCFILHMIFLSFLVETAPVWAEEAASPQTSPSPPSKGLLDVSTQPQGARVSLGGSSPEFRQTLGETPFQIEMDPGAFTLVIEKDGFETDTAEIEVMSGKTARMQVKLEKQSWKTNRGLRIAGHLLFWPGLLTAGTGIILIAQDEPKQNINTGMPGYITAGIGTAMTVIGGIILGLTQSGHRDVYTMPEVSLMTAPDGTGGGVVVQKSF